MSHVASLVFSEVEASIFVAQIAQARYLAMRSRDPELLDMIAECCSELNEQPFPEELSDMLEYQQFAASSQSCILFGRDGWRYLSYFEWSPHYGL